jgi:hypothetical protein
MLFLPRGDTLGVKGVPTHCFGGGGGTLNVFQANGAFAYHFHVILARQDTSHLFVLLIEVMYLKHFFKKKV